jgi:hypothetical protein
MARGISVVITGSAAPLRKAIKDAEGQLGGFSKAAAASMAAGGAAVAVFATQAVKAAAADAQQQAILARTLQNTTGATNTQIAAVEKYIDATQRQVAFSDTELRDSLGVLATATGDVSKAQALMGTVLDTATATQTDAVSVATALAKGYAGNTRALASLSPELKKLIKDGASFSDVLKVLEGNFKGAASTAAGTFQGRMDILRNSIDESKEAIGTALLPVVEKTMGVFASLANLLAQNVAVMGAITVAIGLFAASLAVSNIALATWKAAATAAVFVNKLLGTSFTQLQIAAGGITLIVSAAAAAYLYLKGQKNETADATNELTKALLLEKSAQSGALSQLIANDEAYRRQITSLKQVGLKLSDVTQYIQTGEGKFKTYATALGVFDSTVGSTIDKMDAFANAAGFDPRQRSTNGLYEIASQLVDFSRNAGIARRESQQLASAMSLLGDVGVDVSGAMERAAQAQTDAFNKMKKSLTDAKKQIREYVKGISDAIVGTLSLATAFSEAADSEKSANEGVKTAVQERRDAYATLQQAQASGDAKAYADALDGVAKAEQNVRDAEAVKPKDYTAIFRQQVAAAKQFAGLLQQLIAGGNMSPEAIKQLLSLGPVAGAQVAKDLLAGTNGFTAASLSADLSGVAAAGTAAGMATPGFSEALGATAGRNGGDFYITIQAGVSSPTDIAKTVTGVLNTYGATTGGVKVKVKRPKASTGRRR